MVYDHIDNVLNNRINEKVCSSEDGNYYSFVTSFSIDELKQYIGGKYWASTFLIFYSYKRATKCKNGLNNHVFYFDQYSFDEHCK